MKLLKQNGLSCLAFVISLSALLICSFRCEPITADWMAILVGILALLVTFLVGWQIYKTIEISQFMNNYSKIVDDKIKDVSEDINHIMASFEYILDSHHLLGSRQPLDISIECLMKSLAEALEIIEPNSKKKAIDKVLDEMEMLFNDRNNENEPLTLNNDVLKRYNLLLRKAYNEKADKIEDYIKSKNQPKE